MAANQKSGNNNKLMMTILKGRTFIVLVILLIFFSITADNFLSAGALLTVAKHVALYGILAIGMTYVIITGGIDLSVGPCGNDRRRAYSGGAYAESVRRDDLLQCSAYCIDHRSPRSCYGDDQWYCYHEV